MLGNKKRVRKPAPDSGLDLDAIAKDEIRRSRSPVHPMDPVSIPRDESPTPPAVKEPKLPVTDVEVVDVGRKLSGLARTIKSQQRKATDAILAAGKALKEAQDLLADYAGGSFGKWLSEKVGMGRSTAYRLIAVYETFGACPSVGHHADGDAIRKLAAGPQPAIAKAIAMMEDGQHVDLKIAKKLIADHAPKKKRSNPDPVLLEVPGGFITVRPRTKSDEVEALLIAAIKKLRGERDAA